MASVIQAQLEALRHCIQRLKDKTPSSVEEIEKDVGLQHILVWNLSKAVQLCVGLGCHIISRSGEKALVTDGKR